MWIIKVIDAGLGSISLFMCIVALVFEIPNTLYVNITFLLPQIHKQTLSFSKFQEMWPEFLSPVESYTPVWVGVRVRV